MSDFAFANGTQTLVTDTTHWKQRLTGFGGVDNTPVSRRRERRQSLGSPEWRWCGRHVVVLRKRYDDVLHDPHHVARPVPEPGTWALMISGLGLLGFAARRKTR